MSRLLQLLLCTALAGAVYAHGGSFRGPNGGVPPNAREPGDAEPPPPPPTGPGGPDTPITPPEAAPGQTPETPGDHPSGPDSGGAPPPVPNPQRPQRPGGARTTVLTFESWRFWWGYNKDDIVAPKTYANAEGVTSSSVLHFTGGHDRNNRRDVLRPTRQAVERQIRPALLRSVDRPGDHEDIHGGALVGLGKVGDEGLLALLEAALRNEYRGSRGQRIDFGLQATESAALALGLLPGLDASGKAAVRRVCLEAIADEGLRTRERTWCAVVLGLQRDAEAVPALLDLLDRDYADANVPAGILCGIGLVGPCDETRAALPELVTILREGRFRDREVTVRGRAIAGYALGKLGLPEALDAVLRALDSRTTEAPVRRSAAIAAGALAPLADERARGAAIRSLERAAERAKDPTSRNFALISLGRIGTPECDGTLLRAAENARYGQRPFAALALGTMVWYRDRAAEAGEIEPMDAARRERIVRHLARLSERFKDTDTRAAFLLARGLVRDADAIEPLLEVVCARGSDPVLRGFACTALGLIGDARPDVRDALVLALNDRRSFDLRTQAATALALLRDGAVLDLLLEKLHEATSFAVQSQLIQAIGTLGDARAVPVLVTLLDDKSQPAVLRAMAAVGLGMIGDPRVLPALSRLSRDYNYRASVPDLDELLFIL